MSFYAVKVGLAFHDYRLEYGVIVELKELGLNFTLGDGDIVLSDYRSDAILCHSPRECRRRMMAFLRGKEKFAKIVVGIDPGPRPGVAVVADGEVLEVEELPNVADVRDFVEDLREEYSPYAFIVRVGNGDIVNRNRIINSIVEDFRVEIVDERGTSESVTNRNAEAAKQIAFSRGKRVREKLNLVVSDGYIRELQRRSRIESGGRVTISRDMARRVALGDVSMRRAIEISGDSNGEGESD